MKVTLYKTELYPDYRQVVTDIKGYLEAVAAIFPNFLILDIRDVNEGAESLFIGLQQSAISNSLPLPQYNYAKIGNTYYFMTDWKKDAFNNWSCNAILDYWHNNTSLTVTGTMLNGHDMPDLLFDQSPLTAKYANIHYPIEPRCGHFIRSAEWGHNNNPLDLCVVAHLTIINDDIERDAIIYSLPRHRKDGRYNLDADIGNFGRAKTLNNNEIISINKMWVVPYVWVGEYTGSLTPATNATLGIKAPTQTVPCFWATKSWNQTTRIGLTGIKRYVENINNPTEKIPVFVKVGNFATNLSVPLNNITTEITVDVRFDPDDAFFGVILRNDDMSVDLLPSLTVAFSARRVNERELSRNISTAVGVVSSILSITGGIATGNPFAIAGGVAGAATTFASIATKIEATQSTVEGQAMLNMCSHAWGDADDKPTLLTGIGILQYAMSNGDDVINGLRNYGYIGNIYVKNFDLLKNRNTSTTQNNFVYTGSYRKFDALHLQIDCNYTNRERAQTILRDVLTRGLTVYYTGTTTTADGAIMSPTGIQAPPTINYVVLPPPAEA